MEQSYIFWQHDVVQTIPNAVWTPLLLQARHSESPRNGWSRDHNASAATTVAAGSNGQALPQGTIQVADTTGGGDPRFAFPSSGFLAFRMPGTKDVAVRYTGKTPTSFTGCTLGEGTLTTGMAVRSANVLFKPNFPSLTNMVAEVAFASNGTGVRGIRVNANHDGLTGGQTLVGAVAAANPHMHIQTAEQPAWMLGQAGNFIEVYQSSTGPLDTVIVSLAAPRLVIQTVTSYTGSND